MRKIFYLFMLIIPASMYAQPFAWSHGNSVGSVKLGVFNPAATGAGFIIGYEGGWRTDPYFSIGWSIDWFNRNYTDQNLVSQLNDFYGPNSSLNELRAKTNVHAFPLMGTATVSWPMAPRMRAFFTGGVGGELMLIFYRNYDNPDNDEVHGAFDFAWQLGGGAAFAMGPRSEMLLELDYHYSQPGWEYNVTDPETGRTITLERSFDMSGLMMRAGFRFYF